MKVWIVTEFRGYDTDDEVILVTTSETKARQEFINTHPPDDEGHVPGRSIYGPYEVDESE